jgi:3-methyladenine DNA glycosylase AlkD
MVSTLVRAIRRELKRRADPKKAAPMRAYMKSAMPCLGVMTTPQREIWREVFPRFPLVGFEEWRDAVLLLWREATYREERYAAIALIGQKQYAAHRTMKVLPVYEEIVTTGAWWDFVDSIATHCLRDLLERSPAAMRRRMLAWVRSPDLWKRRAAILCQIGRKEDTDLDLLYHCIRSTMHEREFFIRKGIGWALRDYAWTNPAEVRRFVGEHESGLSPLSRREALKNISGGRV